MEVADQGVGITPEILEQVMNLYFTTKKDGSGSACPCAARNRTEPRHPQNRIAAGSGTICLVRLPPAPDALSEIATATN